MKRMPVVSCLLLLLFQVPLVARSQDEKPKGEAARIWDHRGSVLTIAFTRDGTRIVSGGAARSESVVFWDVKTGQRLPGLKDAGLVYSLALAPDGKRIATAGYTIVDKDNINSRHAVWDAATGKELFALENDSPGARPCIAYSPDGKLLAAGTFTGDGDNATGAVQLWDTRTGKKAGLLVGPSEGFGRLLFSPDGKILAAASWGQQTFVILWDVETRKQRGILKGKNTWALIRSLAFSPDGKRLAWASGNEVNGNAEHVLWDVTTTKRIGSLRTEEMMASVVFGGEGKSLILVGLGGDIHFWDVATLKKTSSVEIDLTFPTMAQSAAIAPDGKTLVIGTGNSDALAAPDAGYGAIRLFDLPRWRERLAPEKEAKRAQDEAVEAERLAAAAKALAQREENERLELAKLSPELRGKITKASAAGQRMHYALQLNQAQQAIERGQLAAARKLLQQQQPEAKQEDLRGFEWHHLWRQCQFQHTSLEQHDAICKSWEGAAPCLSADGKTLAVTTLDHEVTLWDVHTAKERMILRGASGPICHIAWSRDGRFILTAGGKLKRPTERIPPEEEKDDPSTREAILWDIATGKIAAKLPGSKYAIDAVALADDGKLAAIGDRDATVRLWAVPTGKLVTSLPLGESAATLTFSPDGKTLAVGGAQGAVGLWDLVTRKQTLLLAGKDRKPILKLQFRPDGKVLYSTEGDWADNYAARRWARAATGEWKTTRDWKLVDRLALSPDGKRLALAGWYGVALWDEETDREISRVAPRVSGEGLESLLSFSPDSKTLVAYLDGFVSRPQLTLFDAASGALLGSADRLLPASEPMAVHLDVAGKVVAVALPYGRRTVDTVIVLHTTLGQNTRSREYTGSGHGMSLAFSLDNQHLVVSDGQTVYRWDLKNDEQGEIFRSSNMPVRRVGFSADGKTILASHPDGVKIWHADTGMEITLIEADYGTIANDAKSVFVTNADRSISVFSANTGKKTATLATKEEVKATDDDEGRRFRDTVDDSPGSKWVVGRGAILFDAVAKKEVKRWQAEPMPLQFGFTPDEETLVTTDRKGTMTIWDLPAVKQRHVISNGWTGKVAAFSTDNRTAALHLEGGAIALFDLETGIELARLRGLSADVRQMAFSPDGKSLVTGHQDGTLGFWCPVTGAQRLSIRAHSDAITTLVFTSDGATLATAGDRTVHLWRGR